MLQNYNVKTRYYLHRLHYTKLLIIYLFHINYRVSLRIHNLNIYTIRYVPVDMYVHLKNIRAYI